MNTVCNRNQCNGCMACIEACPQNAIKIDDQFTHYNAIIQDEKCIQCNVCHSVCPNNDPSIRLLEPKKWYQGWAEREEIRARSASGGGATALAVSFIEHGGEVCACVFEKGSFCFKCIDDLSALSKIAGSKYVKSNPEGIYGLIVKKLQEGRRILFIGLPCQVAALKKIVSVNLQDNLYSVDLICHGAPSPHLLEMFLQQYGCSLHTIGNIQFREKLKMSISIRGKGIAAAGICDRYSTGFLQELLYTESCYNCHYATMGRAGDVTLGDSWGSELSREEKAKGISLFLIQTEKGEAIVNQAELHKESVDLKKAVENNGQLSRPVRKPDKRDVFFGLIRTGTKFNKAILYCCPRQCIKQNIKGLLIRMNAWSNGGVGKVWHLCQRWKQNLTGKH